MYKVFHVKLFSGGQNMSDYQIATFRDDLRARQIAIDLERMACEKSGVPLPKIDYVLTELVGMVHAIDESDGFVVNESEE